MRDWRAEILGRLRDPSEAREEAVEEIALHLEQRYLRLLARGYSEEQAYADTLREILPREVSLAPLDPPESPLQLSLIHI